jgi:hypothetical protein
VWTEDSFVPLRWNSQPANCSLLPTHTLKKMPDFWIVYQLQSDLFGFIILQDHILVCWQQFKCLHYTRKFQAVKRYNWCLNLSTKC